ncbi:MAG: hypothetical protein HEP71_26115 [Roseivirga sp.]|nr:hypothetical protein [Roseivirga sp.]
MKNSIVYLLLAGSLFLSPLCSAQSWDVDKIENLHQWTFRMSRGADSLGYSRFEVRRIGKQILVSEDSRVPGFYEDMFLYLNGQTLAPDSVLITGRLSGYPIETKFRWNENVVKGYANFPKSAKKPTSSLTKELPENTKPRLASFVLSPFYKDLKEGMKFSYPQFSSMDGAVRTVTAHVVGSETVNLNGMEIEAYRLELSGGVAEQNVFIDKAQPRIVKISFRNIDWIYELINP